MTDKFELIAFDPETAFEPRKVGFIKWSKVDTREDWVWAKVEPSLETWPRELARVFEVVFLSARHEGFSLKAFTNPIHVYVCTVKSDALLLADEVDPDDIEILYWGQILPNN